MTEHELMAFCGGTLSRKAEWRTDQEKIEALWGAAEARVILAGSGLVLVREDPPALARLPVHGLLPEGDQRPPLFLGLDGDVPVFAVRASGDEGERDEEANRFDGCTWQPLRGVMHGLSPAGGELAATASALFNWHDTHGFCARCGANSEITQAGWQRVCPACGAFHFPRTDPVVIMLVISGNSLLVGRSPDWPDGMYSLLAGLVEPGETIAAAVRREVMEETGVKVGKVRYLNDQPWPFPNSLMFGCVGEALSRELTLDLAEVEDAFWITREDAVTVFYGQHETLKAPRKGTISRFLIHRWLSDSL